MRTLLDNRLKIAQIIAAIGTAFSVVGIILNYKMGVEAGLTLMGIGMIAACVAYLFGGLFTAIRMAGGIAKWGWIAVPFPFDIATFIIAFVYALFAFLFLPIIPVRRAVREQQGVGI
jgi:hypothetical protein